MKKALSIVLSILMLFSAIFAAPASAISTANITLNDNTYSFGKGSTFTYKCSMTVNEITENGEFRIHYPEDLLKITTVEFPVVTPKGGLMYLYGTENTKNQMRFAYSKASSNAKDLYDFTQGGVLVNITFEVVSVGNGEIFLEKLVASNMQSVNIVSTASFSESLIIHNQIDPVKISATKKNIYVKKKAKLKVTGGSEDSVTWNSSNKKVATVNSNGVVTAKKAGKTTVTAVKDGITMECVVKVKNPTIKVKNNTIRVNKSTKINVKNAVGKTKFKALNKFAKVNSKGKVTGLKKGTAKIKVVASGVKFTVKIKVK